MCEIHYLSPKHGRRERERGGSGSSHTFPALCQTRLVESLSSFRYAMIKPSSRVAKILRCIFLNIPTLRESVNIEGEIKFSKDTILRAYDRVLVKVGQRYFTIFFCGPPHIPSFKNGIFMFLCTWKKNLKRQKLYRTKKVDHREKKTNNCGLFRLCFCWDLFRVKHFSGTRFRGHGTSSFFWVVWNFLAGRTFATERIRNINSIDLERLIHDSSHSVNKHSKRYFLLGRGLYSGRLWTAVTIAALVWDQTTHEWGKLKKRNYEITWTIIQTSFVRDLTVTIRRIAFAERELSGRKRSSPFFCLFAW